MGIAAYNRGTRLLRRQIDEQFDHDVDVVNRLNSLPRGEATILQATVVRSDKGRWWIMDNEVEGWGAFGYPFDSLSALFARFNVYITGCGQDATSFFYRVAMSEGRS